MLILVCVLVVGAWGVDAPAHPHATSAAVYPALFFHKSMIYNFDIFSRVQRDSTPWSVGR